MALTLTSCRPRVPPEAPPRPRPWDVLAEEPRPTPGATVHRVLDAQDGAVARPRPAVEHVPAFRKPGGPRQLKGALLAPLFYDLPFRAQLPAGKHVLVRVPRGILSLLGHVDAPQPFDARHRGPAGDDRAAGTRDPVSTAPPFMMKASNVSSSTAFSTGSGRRILTASRLRPASHCWPKPLARLAPGPLPTRPRSTRPHRWPRAARIVTANTTNNPPNPQPIHHSSILRNIVYALCLCTKYKILEPYWRDLALSLPVWWSIGAPLGSWRLDTIR